jgi:hypothetical protein
MLVCIRSTASYNCRVVKVLFDTGSTPFNFVRDEIADWIEAEELKLHNVCYLSTEERHQQTAVSLAGTGAHTVVSHKNLVFNLLLFNELKQNTELLPCLLARTIPTRIDVIIGLPTIRKHDLVLKIPSHFSNYKSDGLADNFTNCVPAGSYLFGAGSGPSGSESFCMTCRSSSEHNKTRLELNAVTELNSGSKVNSGSKLNSKSKQQQFRVKTTLPTAMQPRKLRKTLSRANGLSMTHCYGLECCLKLRMLSESR